MTQLLYRSNTSKGFGEGFLLEDNKFLMKAGSLIEWHDFVMKKSFLNVIFMNLRDAGKITEDGMYFKFTEDVTFTSPLFAIQFITMSENAGIGNWIREDGLTMREVLDDYSGEDEKNKKDEDEIVFYCKHRDSNAVMALRNGIYCILKGSQITHLPAKKECSFNTYDFLRKLVNRGYLKYEFSGKGDLVFTFTTDYFVNGYKSITNLILMDETWDSRVWSTVDGTLINQFIRIRPKTEKEEVRAAKVDEYIEG